MSGSDTVNLNFVKTAARIISNTWYQHKNYNTSLSNFWSSIVRV